MTRSSSTQRCSGVTATWVAAIVATIVSCGDVEPDDPYATSVPSTMTTAAGTSDDAGGTAATDSATDSSASSAGTVGTPTTTADNTGADVTGADTTAAGEGSGGESGCQPGAEGCPCTDMDTCDPGLACLSTVCVDPGPVCPIGTPGCPCTQGGACDPDLTCVSNVCVAR